MRSRRALRRQIGKGFDSPGRIGGDGAQQFAKLMRRACVEAAVGAVCQPRNFTVSIFRHRIVAFLKHESPYAKQPQFTGRLAKMVDWLFHGIPYEHQSLYLLARVLLPGMTQNFVNLRLPSPAIDARHQFRQPFAAGNPTGCAAFVQTSKINKLDIEPADAGSFPKHVGLQRTG